MLSFRDTLKSAIDGSGLRGKPILLAVSGGADSVAMLRGMKALQTECRLDLVVGHLDHQLRGADSKADAEWLKALCQRLDLTIEIGEQDIRQCANRSKTGIEEAARHERYRFLETIATARKCAAIAVAHTANDQTETILHHIIRGSGLAGLRGMHPLRTLGSGILLVRPLLEVSRHQVEAYLAELGQDYRNDPSNRDSSLTRNRIRQTLLPLLERDFNPQVSQALHRLSRQAREIEMTFDVLCSDILERAILDQNQTIVRVNCEVLAKSPRHLIRECFVRLWRGMTWPQQQMGFDQWDQLAELCLIGGSARFPGNIQGFRRGTLLVLEPGRVKGSGTFFGDDIQCKTHKYPPKNEPDPDP